jgi:hypothetical protein
VLLVNPLLCAVALSGAGLTLPEHATASPESTLDSGWRLWARPWTRSAEGNFRPKTQNGDTEDGWFSARVGLDTGARAGPAVVELRGRTGLDLIGSEGPLDLAAETWKLGLETERFHLRFGQIPRWIGPGRHGSLVFTNLAQPPPGGDLGGKLQLPGKAGEVEALMAAGWLGGARADVDSPGWLLMDIRWTHPIFEIGWARSSIFGGYEEGVARPVDLGQLLLPTQPHVEDDPLHLLPDTDELAAWDIRLRLPVGEWFELPIDALEAYIQHGGEDIIARQLGPIPYPTLAGVANLYGIAIAARQLTLEAELAVLEDDLFRWYTGHRVYHDGWTHGGDSLGHPWGGDQRDLVVRGAWLESEAWSASLAFEWVRRLEVADRIESTVYVLPGIEQRRYVHGAGALWLPEGAQFQLEVSVGTVENADFLLGKRRIEHRVGLTYWAPLRAWSKSGVIHQDR